MSNPTNRLREENLRILNSFKPLADAIAKTFGGFCEAVIHDFSDPDHSLVYISGNVTKRKCGAPITNLVLQALKMYGDSVPDMIGYRSVTRDGRDLKCTTVFIRRPGHGVIGCFCINIDISDLKSGYARLGELLSTVGDDDLGNQHEEFVEDVPGLVRTVLSSILETSKNPADLSKDDKLALVEKLETKGLFLVKGVIEEVARLMNISKHTVYRYLDEVRRHSHSNL